MQQISPGKSHQEAIRRIFLRHYAHLHGRPVPPFRIEFYPYSRLAHTIRARQGEITVRISDILADAPLEILSAVIVILLYKLFRKAAPPHYQHTYRHYIKREPIRRRALSIRKLRGRKRFTSARGVQFDLTRLFDELNRHYFGGKLKITHLSWSRRDNRRILGHYDAAYQAIVINRKLDHPGIPAFVVRYVLYHEMLHAAWGEESCQGRRQVHHRLFREAERQFPHYAEARRFIRTRLQAH